MIPPCKDCKDRHEGCHGKCYRYREFRAEKDKLLEAKKEDFNRARFSAQRKRRPPKREGLR